MKAIVTFTFNNIHNNIRILLYMDLLLDPQQVQNIAGIPIQVVKYSDLHRYRTLNGVFGKKKAVLLLYERKPNLGHWVCMIKHKDGIQYFDSYGFEPDDPLQFTNIEYKKKLNMDLPYLTALMLYSPQPIDFSDRQLQKASDNINTCGRWTGLRMRHYKLTNDDFLSLFEDTPINKTDKLITKLTEKYII